MADSKAVDLSSPTARRRLRSKANRAPYYKSLGEGRFLGYRKAAAGPGTWTARAYVGGKRYKEEVLGTADDVSPADGTVILEYRQAMDAALAWCRTALDPQPEESAGVGWTLGQAMSAYLEWFKAHRKGYASARTVIETHVLRSFGRDTVVAPVYCPSGAPYPFSAAGIRRWHQELAAAPARFRPGKERQKTRPAPAGADEVRARKATANRVLTYLRAALNFNVAEGKIPKAVETIWTSVRPFRKVDKPRIRFFDAEETSRLLNVCDPDFKHLVTGALLTGGRYGGLTAMLVRERYPQEVWK